MSDATVVITTRNRVEDLIQAIASCVSQIGVDLDVIVYDDASTDGTSQRVAEQFPSVRLVRSDKRRGYISLRNQGFRDATGPIVFSIDDDAQFSDSQTVAGVLREFNKDSHTAAFALCYVEPNRLVRQGFMKPLESGSKVRSYIGCAHAIRRDLALQFGGYPEYLKHQGEERDLCLRMLDAGYPIRYICCSPIIHTPSPKRDHFQLAYLGLRNTFLFDVIRVPFPYVLKRLPADVFLLLKHRITVREFPLRLWFTLRALVACACFLPRRNAVRRETYRIFCSLPSHGPIATPAELVAALGKG